MSERQRSRHRSPSPDRRRRRSSSSSDRSASPDRRRLKNRSDISERHKSRHSRRSSSDSSRSRSRSRSRDRTRETQHKRKEDKLSEQNGGRDVRGRYGGERGNERGPDRRYATIEDDGRVRQRSPHTKEHSGHQEHNDSKGTSRVPPPPPPSAHPHANRKGEGPPGHSRDGRLPPPPPPPTAEGAHQSDGDGHGAKVQKKADVQPDFGYSGKLAEETNKVKGVVMKYTEPPEAGKPTQRWRLYVFKGGEEFGEPLYIHRQSWYMFGRERRIVDVPTDHPSCSKQHAVIQFRTVEKADEWGVNRKNVVPYVMDLASVNGTFLNNERIDGQRYYELKVGDLIRFGLSSREYVLLHEGLA